MKCSFLEIYNEELIDLLDPAGVNKNVKIREEKNGKISVYGLQEKTVKTSDEMAHCLNVGSESRRTACTQMNQASSRSHGIFTITIEQNMLGDLL